MDEQAEGMGSAEGTASSVALQLGPASAAANEAREEAEQKAMAKATALLANLPVQLDVCIPLPNFRVSDLVSLEVGRVFPTTWEATEDLPLCSGRVQLVWAEFEVVDQKIAVRVTRML
jgi:flagellar motor switch protein FliN